MMITKEIKKELLHTLKMKKLFGIEHIVEPRFSVKKREQYSLPNDLNELEKHVNNCSLCELSKSNDSIIFSKGDVLSDILCIGYNINLNDEKEFLIIKKMIENVLNININDVYMTNILKCINNRDNQSFSSEVEKCIPYLEKQIMVSKPKIIITFGNAFKFLMKNNEDIIDISGTKFDYSGITVVPLLEPKFINKNPSYKEKMFQDLKKIKKIMDEK